MESTPTLPQDRVETGTDGDALAQTVSQRVARLKVMPDGGVLFREDGAHFILYRSDLPALAAAFDDGSVGEVSP